MTLTLTLKENNLFNMMVKKKLVNHTKFADTKLNLVEYSTRIDTYSHHCEFEYDKYSIFVVEYDVDESIEFSIDILEPKYVECLKTKDVDKVIDWINVHDGN